MATKINIKNYKNHKTMIMAMAITPMMIDDDHRVRLHGLTGVSRHASRCFAGFVCFVVPVFQAKYIYQNENFDRLPNTNQRLGLILYSKGEPQTTLPVHH